jgi:hypothetical protein
MDKQITRVVIDYRGNGQPTQVRASLWYGELLDAQGEKVEGIASDDWGAIERHVRRRHPEAKQQYTQRGWAQNVSEFERNRSCSPLRAAFRYRPPCKRRLR